MRRLAIISILLACLAPAFGQEPVDYVSTLVGTQSKPSFSTGNTYPATARPWGMNFWTPQTGPMGDGWAYTYDANWIRGFKQTHQPSPWINDYGQFAVMPMVWQRTVHQDQRASYFSHKSEIAKPHYYRAYLADYDISLEISPTSRAAMMRVSYPEADTAYFCIDALDGGSAIEIDPARRRVAGYSTKNSGGVPDNFRNYFVIEFDRPLAYCAVADSCRLDSTALSVQSGHAAALVGFKAAKGDPVIVRVASSFISPEQALANLGELDGKTFDDVVAEGRDEWNDVLGRFEIDDPDVDRKRAFYSCLYRCLLFPQGIYEYGSDGRPMHYSPYDGQAHDGYLYAGTGFWDTFRALFPLVNLVYPSEGAKIQAGWANAYRESGFLPEWSSPGHRDCMVGNNSAAVIADAHLKGLTDPNDAETLWQAVTHGANASHPQVSSTGRLGWEWYNDLGYVPCDVGINESAARSLEYAFDDWCIHQMGSSLGKSEEEIGIYAQRAQNYRNLFDPSTRLMRGKKADGQFRSPFNPLKWGGDFTEGNSWHYTWSVFHDPEGLIGLMGGNEAFCEKLDSVFALPPDFDPSYYGYVIHEIREMQTMGMGNYAHGNQPIQHMIYLYDYAGHPEKTQYWTRQAMDRLYSAAPDGYCGDEDNGQTSAWYVFSAMGFYPVCPASNEYALGIPLFRRMTVRLENGNAIIIEGPSGTAKALPTDQAPAELPYRPILVNGAQPASPSITWQQLQQGASLKCQD